MSTDASLIWQQATFLKKNLQVKGDFPFSLNGPSLASSLLFTWWPANQTACCFHCKEVQLCFETSCPLFFDCKFVKVKTTQKDYLQRDVITLFNSLISEKCTRSVPLHPLGNLWANAGPIPCFPSDTM